MYDLAVVGQGYVGLPLAIESSQVGLKVIGIDIDLDVVRNLNRGVSHIEDVSDNALKIVLEKNKFSASNDYSLLRQARIIAVCVPTPLDQDRNPDLTFIINAIKNVADNLQSGALVVIESTIEPGFTRNQAYPLLSKGGSSKTSFKLAYSPERIDPRNKRWNLKNTPKLVAGLTPEALTEAKNFYSKFVKEIHSCESLEVAETAKLLENTFRLVNISFINEFSEFCTKLDVNINEVINAASTKPYGYLPFYPSPGAGGHCIPVDPIYLLNKARNIGAPTQFIKLADEVNLRRPYYLATQVENYLETLLEKRILVIGVSYKPDVADTRETPVSSLITALRDKGAYVDWHDELVKKWNGETSSEITDNYDLAVLATKHSNLNLENLKNTPVLTSYGSIL